MKRLILKGFKYFDISLTHNNLLAFIIFNEVVN